MPDIATLPNLLAGWRFELIRDPTAPGEDRIVVHDPQALGSFELLLKDPQIIHRSFYRLALDLVAAAASSDRDPYAFLMPRGRSSIPS